MTGEKFDSTRKRLFLLNFGECALFYFFWFKSGTDFADVLPVKQ